MSGSVQIVDARGLPCPQPVVLVRKALEALAAGGKDGIELTVLVDNDTARENVVRYASYVGRETEVLNGPDGATKIVIMSPDTRHLAGSAGDSGGPRESQEVAAGAAPKEGAAQASTIGRAVAVHSVVHDDLFTIFLASDRIGQGDDELGALLMKGFLYAVAESDAKPVRMIFMNSGVKLTVEGSTQLENLRRLQEAGVDMLSCGTCLDFYGLKEKLAVGRVSNMYEIVGFLSSGRVLRP